MTTRDGLFERRTPTVAELQKTIRSLELDFLDHYASAALTGLLAWRATGAEAPTDKELAAEAFAIADCMMAERAKRLP
jgi:hypothetical protein